MVRQTAPNAPSRGPQTDRALVFAPGATNSRVVGALGCVRVSCNWPTGPDQAPPKYIKARVTGGGIMADNTARARTQLEGHRKAVREHTRKHRDYPTQQDKDFAWKTIQNAQSHISKIKSEHPSLNSSESEDTWKPGDRTL